MTPETGRCSGCSAPIIWAYTEQGRRIPLDEHPVDTWGDGTYFTLEGHRATVASPLLVQDDQAIYQSHFATCPDADTFRRGR